MDTHNAYVQLVGGGGGAGGITGGGGGAYNEANVSISRSRIYHVSLGNGGAPYTGSSSFVSAGNGGTTSAFDISALGGLGAPTTNMNDYNRIGGTGGGAGAFQGGNGGADGHNGSPAAYANANFNFGGGGAGAARCYTSSSVPVRVNIAYGGFSSGYGWYNDLTVYYENKSPIRGLTYQQLMYGANGGGNSCTISSIYGNRNAMYIYDPITSEFYSLYEGAHGGRNHRITFPTNLSSTGSSGVNGGGGGAGGWFTDRTYINLNITSFSPGRGGTGLCWVTILD